MASFLTGIILLFHYQFLLGTHQSGVNPGQSVSQDWLMVYLELLARCPEAEDRQVMADLVALRTSEEVASLPVQLSFRAETERNCCALKHWHSWRDRHHIMRCTPLFPRGACPPPPPHKHLDSLTEVFYWKENALGRGSHTARWPTKGTSLMRCTPLFPRGGRPSKVLAHRRQGVLAKDYPAKWWSADPPPARSLWTGSTTLTPKIHHPSHPLVLLHMLFRAWSCWRHSQSIRRSSSS